jgi:hypothetical protein
VRFSSPYANLRAAPGGVRSVGLRPSSLVAGQEFSRYPTHKFAPERCVKLKDEQNSLHAGITDFSSHVELMYDKREIRKITKRTTRI